MKTRLVGFVFGWVLLLLSVPFTAQERITLTTPETVAALGQLEIERIIITPDRVSTPEDEGAILVQLIGVERPVAISCFYSKSTTPLGTFLVNALMKANLSSVYAGNATTGTLPQRIYHRLVIMNEAPAVCGRSLTGTLTGTPQ